MIDRMTEKAIRLLLGQKEPITTSVIANEIGVSRSNIKHNLDYVKKTLQKAGILLNSIPGEGVWLSADDHQRKAVLQLLQENSDHSSSYDYRKKYILDVLFEYNSSYTIQLFAEELSVARNVITKDLEVLEQWLLKFDLEIVKERNMGIGVAGGEFNIRQAILENNKEFMNEIYGSGQTPEGMDYHISEKFYNYFLEMCGGFDILYLQELLKNVEDDLGMTFMDTGYWQFMEYVAVTLCRVRKGNVIVEENIMNKLNVNNDRYTIVKSLFDTVIHGLQVHLGLEIRCTAAQFIVFNNHGLDDEIDMGYFDAIIKEFLEHFKAIIASRRLVISEGLVHDVSFFIQKEKAQKTSAISKWYDFRQDIKHRFSGLYGITLATIEEAESCLKISFTNDDIAYIVMLTNNAIDESDRPVNAVLISAADFHTSKYQVNKIIRNVENLAISKILHYEDIKESSTIKLELTITIVPLELKKNVPLVSREISDDDLEKVSRAITEKQNVEVTDRDEASQLFNPKLILCDVNARRREDAISRDCQLLYKKGYVKKGFERKVWEREKTTPTSIGNSAAVPHGYKTYVKKSGIVVTCLKRPMNQTYEGRIETVFLMAIDSNTQSEVYNFFQQFYAFIDDRSNIKVLKNARDEMEIWEILQQSGITIQKVRNTMGFGVDTFIWNEVFPEKDLWVITKAEELGLSTIDIAIAHPETFPTALVKAEPVKTKLKVVTTTTLDTRTNLISPDEAIRKNGVEALKRLVDINKELGSTILGGANYASQGCLNGKLKTDEEWNHFVGAMRETAQYAKETYPQLRICVEPVNRFEAHFTNTAKEDVRYRKVVGTGSMAAYLGCFHMIHEETSHRETAGARGKAYLGYVHACENNRDILGTGLVSWEEFFVVLHDIGYKGPCVIESFDSSFEKLNVNCVIWRKSADTEEELVVQELANLKCIAAGLGV